MKPARYTTLPGLPNWVHIDAGSWVFCERCGDEERLPAGEGPRLDAAWVFAYAHRHDVATASADQLRRDGEAFRALFDDGPCGRPLFHAWEIAGEARRGKPGRDVVHVVRAAWHATDQAAVGGNLVQLRVAELLVAGEISGGPIGTPRGGAADGHRAFVVPWRRRRHVLHFAEADDWGVKLARHTGPVRYWRMLRLRLRLAGTLDVDDRGRVCWVDRLGGGAPRLHPFAVRDEATFFRLARTRWTAPCGRYDPHDSAWPRGILPPWYPPEVPYRSARAEPHLFTRPSPRRRRQPERLLSGPAAAADLVPNLEDRS